MTAIICDYFFRPNFIVKYKFKCEGCLYSDMNMDERDERPQIVLRRRPYLPRISRWDQAQGCVDDHLQHGLSITLHSSQSGRESQVTLRSCDRICSSGEFENTSLDSFRDCESQSNPTYQSSRVTYFNVRPCEKVWSCAEPDDFSHKAFIGSDNESGRETQMSVRSCDQICSSGEFENTSLDSFSDCESQSNPTYQSSRVTYFNVRPCEKVWSCAEPDDFSHKAFIGSDNESGRETQMSVRSCDPICSSGEFQNTSLDSFSDSEPEVGLAAKLQANTLPAHVDQLRPVLHTAETSLLQRTKAQEENLRSIDLLLSEGLRKYSDIGKVTKESSGCLSWFQKWLSRKKDEKFNNEMPGTRTDVEVIHLVNCNPQLDTLNEVFKSPEQVSYLLPGQAEPFALVTSAPQAVPSIVRATCARDMPCSRHAVCLPPITNLSHKAKKLLQESASSSQTGETILGTEIDKAKKRIVKKDKTSLRKRFLSWLLPKQNMRK
ncbi:hypothetical protein DPEC_G00008790 [Dallia pectoralis]|uniref:Uncharacterized protein n=1 Tax=Dallia pectoralis TaxID=75939 RepID=A0ACC2HKQ7_DALPE|nr:hypothetical protein DPEC_G00008790 [Dallia pectoralis]